MIKVGIVTFHRAYNYGAYLQSCALCGRLNQEPDIDAEIIDFCTQKERNMYASENYSLRRKAWKILKGTYRFSKELEETFRKAQSDPLMKKSADSLVSDSIEEFASFVKGRYDVIITGSDEVWKADGIRGFPSAYWLIGDLGCAKMSYAASGRVDYDKLLDEDGIRILEDALNDFDYITVRDRQTQEQIGKHTAKEVHLVCDPSFLYDFTIPENGIEALLPKGEKLDPSLKTIALLVDDVALAGQIGDALSGKYNLIFTNKSIKGYTSVPTLSPIQWLSLIRQADFVITSFFHGACFSIVNNTPFLAIGTKKKKSKLTELLNGDALETRYIEADIESPPDYAGLVKKLMTDVDFSSEVAGKRSGFTAFLENLRKAAAKA